jgi:excisionase family DNA binding protein
MTGKEVCNLLKISSRTLLRYADAGLIPAVRVGSIRRYRRTDVAKSIKTYKPVAV